jgi:hypothetical protein
MAEIMPGLFYVYYINVITGYSKQRSCFSIAVIRI